VAAGTGRVAAGWRAATVNSNGSLFKPTAISKGGRYWFWDFLVFLYFYFFSIL
jgi:hypothetical protein